MARIGFITTAAMPEMPFSDRLTQLELENLGHSVIPLPWEAGRPEEVDLIVFRSCWNYHLHQPEFFAWLRSLKSCPIPIQNSVDKLLWNLDKRYLLEFANEIPLIPTGFLEHPTADAIKREAAERGWEAVVVKPIVGCTSFQNYLLREEADYAGLESEALPDHYLVQPYRDSIRTVGEIALMYFNGKFSHSILKRAKDADYRVQEEFGGSVEAYQSDERHLEVGQLVMSALDFVPLYARIDLVEGPAGPELMEIELAEPELYLDESSAKTFALAIESRLT